MTYLEALRQRQIILEHKRRADIFEVGYGIEDQEHFDAEMASINEIVNAMWLRQACS